MKIALLLASVIILSVIAWQDFRCRSVWMVLFISEAALTISLMIFSHIPGYWKMALVSTIAAAIQIALIWSWFRLTGKSDAFFDSLFGWGDLVMIALAAINFSVFAFIIFMIISSLSGLIWYLIQKYLRPGISTTIPLAGIIALLLVPVQICSCFWHNWFYLNILTFKQWM